MEKPLEVTLVVLKNACIGVSGVHQALARLMEMQIWWLPASSRLEKIGSNKETMASACTFVWGKAAPLALTWK